MNRRNFLSLSSSISLPIVLNGFKIGAMPMFMNSGNIENEDRVLVLIQLFGGNDGLNTVIPLESFDNLALARPNIYIPESEILNINNEIGFHPAFSEMKDLYDNGHMHIVQGVAYPNQNRSHFRSSDIWNSGSSAENFIDSGWLGRYFQTYAEDFPSGYPNETYPDPFALTVGTQIAETCQGDGSNYSIAINKPEDLLNLSESGNMDFPNNLFGRELSFLVDAISQTNAYAVTVKEAASKGNNLSQLYDDDNELAQQLKTVAQLISGGLKTKVYIVSLGGFDTHSAQTEEDNSTTGVHSTLLEILSKAINAFWDDINLLGINHRITGMTFSEFGRQIKANDSYGTDHGTAAPLFLFGNCVNPGISGEAPIIDKHLEPQEGTPMQFDFRSVYGSVLTDWFGSDKSSADSVLDFDFQRINIFKDCEISSSIQSDSKIAIKLFPNPSHSIIHVDFNDIYAVQKITFFDHRGGDVSAHVVSHGVRSNQLLFDISRLLEGNYFVHLQFSSTNAVKKFVKVNL